MEIQKKFRAKAILAITNEIPKSFWLDARARLRQAYMDAYYEVAADANVLSQQKLDKLYQSRCFRMEHELAELAKTYKLSHSTTILIENSRHYVYVVTKSLGITQSYIPSINGKPKAAKFRDRLSAINAIEASPRFPGFDNEPSEVFVNNKFYGIVAHNPIGKRFTEEEQKLGMVQFCIPSDGCKNWLVQLSIEEILEQYSDLAVPETKPERKPTWKKQIQKQEA